MFQVGNPPACFNTLASNNQGPASSLWQNSQSRGHCPPFLQPAHFQNMNIGVGPQGPSNTSLACQPGFPGLDMGACGPGHDYPGPSNFQNAFSGSFSVPPPGMSLSSMHDRSSGYPSLNLPMPFPYSMASPPQLPQLSYPQMPPQLPPFPNLPPQSMQQQQQQQPMPPPPNPAELWQAFLAASASGPKGPLAAHPLLQPQVPLMPSATLPLPNPAQLLLSQSFGAPPQLLPPIPPMPAMPAQIQPPPHLSLFPPQGPMSLPPTLPQMMPPNAPPLFTQPGPHPPTSISSTAANLMQAPPLPAPLPLPPPLMPPMPLHSPPGSSYAFDPNEEQDRQERQDKRRLSNRESARRSRMRRQLESHRLVSKVEKLQDATRRTRAKAARLQALVDALESQNAEMQAYQNSLREVGKNPQSSCGACPSQPLSTKRPAGGPPCDISNPSPKPRSKKPKLNDQPKVSKPASPTPQPTASGSASQPTASGSCSPATPPTEDLMHAHSREPPHWPLPPAHSPPAPAQPQSPTDQPSSKDPAPAQPCSTVQQQPTGAAAQPPCPAPALEPPSQQLKCRKPTPGRPLLDSCTHESGEKAFKAAVELALGSGGKPRAWQATAAALALPRSAGKGVTAAGIAGDSGTSGVAGGSTSWGTEEAAEKALMDAMAAEMDKRTDCHVDSDDGQDEGAEQVQYEYVVCEEASPASGDSVEGLEDACAESIKGFSRGSGSEGDLGQVLGMSDKERAADIAAVKGAAALDALLCDAP